MPGTVPSALSAVAATIAAVCAGITLYVTGRRDRRRWIRESLAEFYLEFLTGSFDSPGRSALGAGQPAALVSAC